MLKSLASSLSNGNAPWWVWILRTFGWPVAVASFLLWFITMSQASTLKEVHDKVDANNVILTEASKNMRDFVEQDRVYRAAALRYWHQICINTSADLKAASACGQLP